MRRSVVGAGNYSLRAPEPADAEALISIKNDPEIAALVRGTTRTYSVSDLRNWVEAHRAAQDEAFFVITDKDDTAIGHVALYRIDPIVGSAEFGILLGDKEIWGKGVGTRVTRHMIEFGFDELRLRRIYLEVLATNQRAKGLYERLGFRVEGQLREHQYKSNRHVDVVVMGLFPHEYRRDAG